MTRAGGSSLSVQWSGQESVIAVTGVATPNPAAPGGVEVTEPAITLLGTRTTWHRLTP